MVHDNIDFGPASATYGLESYISVPVITASGEYFGNLCGIDPRLAKVSDQRVVRIRGIREPDRHATGEPAPSVDDGRSAGGRGHDLETSGQFGAVLGHDLRNPLAAVDATTELLVRQSESAAWRAAGQRLKCTAQHVSRLIDHVLDFARGRLGSGIVVSVQQVDNLNDLLLAVVDELRIASPSRHIEGELTVDRTVVCDAIRIQQLLWNLLGNALTPGAEQSPVCVRAAINASYLLLSVANGGEPFPANASDESSGEPFLFIVEIGVRMRMNTSRRCPPRLNQRVRRPILSERHDFAVIERIGAARGAPFGLRQVHTLRYTWPRSSFRRFVPVEGDEHESVGL